MRFPTDGSDAMQRSAVRFVLCAATVFAIGACSTFQPPRSESQSDPSVNLAAYRSYAWQLPSGEKADAPTTLADLNIRTAIAKELERRGYVQDEDNPDFRVGYETVEYEKVKSNPFRIGIGMGTWGGNTGGSVGVGTSGIDSYQEGRLVIHVYDAKSNREVWLGTTTGRLPDTGPNEKSIEKTVALTIQDFPTRTPMP
jgi:hypothetical protein